VNPALAALIDDLAKLAAPDYLTAQAKQDAGPSAERSEPVELPAPAKAA
jgi:hypothetical protein